ncbi:MAG: AAA family ATPase [Oscillospiraceae bacterium]|nr:AAA family ATPase [Oscillospiraceae bacterium]
MLATHRVKNSAGDTIGFIIDKGFYNENIIKQNINEIENLKLLKNGTIRARKKLPDVQYKATFTQRKYEELKANNPFVRDITEELADWKENNYKSILQIEGARQVGKTTEILKFAYSNYEYVIYINLIRDDYGFESCIKQNMTYMEMYKYCIRANLPNFDNSRNTIIIIDEIQENAKVFNALRTLRAEINCDIVITGSYLGTLTSNFTKDDTKKIFFSMGTVMPVTMFSMSFREFCRAFTEENLLMNINVHGKSEPDKYLKLQKLYDIYCTIGGYPDVVLKYKKTRNVKECFKIIGKLLSMFKQESSRYFKDAKQITVFDLVYEQAIVEMLTEKRGSGKKIIEYITDFINKGGKALASRDEVSNAITWLIKCNMISTCSMIEGNDFINKQPNRRMYFTDCGIASYILNSLALTESAKKGLITETFAFCELNRLFFENINTRKVKDRLCFSLYNQFELDFMLVGKGENIDNMIFGIEVKSNKGNPKSLKVYIDKSLIDKGILAENTSGRHGENYETIPIYTIGARFPYRD